MRFVKMHGLGNDYVYVNAFEQDVADPGALAVRISDRHFGVGADGLILIHPSDVADVRMQMFNADGSEAEMCGNGIRCVAKFAHDRGLSDANPLRVETRAGVKSIALTLDDEGRVDLATVDMGEPVLDPAGIVVKLPGDRVVDAPIEIESGTFHMTCVSMGNPHAVVFTVDVASVELERIGPAFEHHELFPNRVNAHFVQVHSPDEVTMRTWERGSGITLACGTGAAAVCVAGVLTGRTGREIIAHLPGGDLRLRWGEDDNHVYMTGPAREVFTGDWPDESRG